MHILLTTEEGTQRASVVPGSTVLSVLQDRQIPLVTPCGGTGRCGLCRVMIRDSRGSHYGRACQTEVEEGMEVVLRKSSGIMILKSGRASAAFGRLLSIYPPDSHESDSLGERTGIALDVGTTTLVCRLHDLRSGACFAQASQLNPQVRYGADLLMRIDSSRAGMLDEMREALVSAVNRMVEQLCVDTHIAHEDIAAVSLVGNTVMEHIAAGLSPDTLGAAPFTPLSTFGEMRDFSPALPAAWYAPSLGGYVGGDVVAGLLATGLARSTAPRMFIDVGTNGEIALGSSSGVLCCSTAAGPAFEGVGILFGMPALPGAISSVRLERGDIVCETIGDIVPHGICGTGLVDALMVMLELGVIDGEGRMGEAEMLPETLRERIDEREGVKVFLLDVEHGVYLTQKDVRALQLSKAALCAGATVLAHEYGVDFDEIEQVYIAGGFGTHLSLSSIEGIRMLPRGLAEKGEIVGNAAIEGASCALLSQVAREEMCAIAESCTHLELATHPDFNAVFMESLNF